MTDPLTPPPVPEAEPVVLAEPVAPAEPAPFDAAPSSPVAAAPAGAWNDVLAPGETVLWEGNPEGIEAGNLAELFRNLMLVGFIVFALFIAASATDAGPAVLVPMAVAGIALFQLVRRRRIAGHADRTTRYLLTNRAAYIRQAEQTEAFPITRDTRFALGRRSVIFAKRVGYDSNGHKREIPVGFTDISGAERLLSLMREIQKGKQ